MKLKGKVIGMILTCIVYAACAFPVNALASVTEVPALTEEITDSRLTEGETETAGEPAITLNVHSVTVNKGKKLTLKATVENADKARIKWRSKNKKVATVNKKGVVTAKKKGSTVITAAIRGTGIKAKCKVKVTNIITMTVKTTGYCSCSRCCGRWANGRTATGTRPKQGRTIAVDRRLIRLGTKVRIGNNTYIAEDVGGAIKGKKIDVYYATHQQALAHGVKYQKIQIYL